MSSEMEQNQLTVPEAQLVEVKREDFPAELPILPLKNTVIFPFTLTPLTVGRPGSIKLVDDVTAGNKLLGVITQRDPSLEQPGPDDLYQYGTICKILRMIRYPKNTIMMLVQGLARFQITQFTKTAPYLIAKIAPLESLVERD
ncbi:LON peptidase substrate-binding domain-containing protein, partial [Candidatus Acetothermia bacterium]|nr:LON peptidase substrate-binding domain-containing protein [Candidatus Acetothermia bacterium]